MKVLSAIAGLLVIMIIAACDTTATPTAVTTAPTSVGSQPTATAGGGQATATRVVTGLVTQTGKKGPAFTFMPRRGGPDTIVSITGGNFTPGQTVAIRIGIPDPIGEPLASPTAGDDGRWNTTIKIPGTEPSGKAITVTDMKIVVMDENNNIMATESFKFIPTP